MEHIVRRLIEVLQQQTVQYEKNNVFFFYILLCEHFLLDTLDKSVNV